MILHHICTPEDILYSTLRVTTDYSNEEIRAFIEAIKKESPKMSIAELQKEIEKLKVGKQMNNSSVLEKFIEEITNKVPTDDKIILNTTNIEIRTKKCIPDKFVQKKIILSWVEPKGENNET